jgi:hypothetical protein
VASAGGSQNNIALGTYLTGSLSNGIPQMGATNLWVQPGATQATVRLNTSSSAVFGSGSGLNSIPFPGAFAFARNASSTSIFAAEKDGSSQIVYGNASQSVTSNSIYLLGKHDVSVGYGNGQQIAFSFIATSTSATDLSNILLDAYNYLVSIGAQ